MFNLNTFARARVSAQACVTFFDGKGTKAAKFNTVAPCHRASNLFKNSVDDIFDEIAVQPYAYLGKDNNISEKSEVNNLATDKLLDSVDYDITAIDVIAQRCNMPVQQAMAELLEYELRGLVAAIPGGYVKLRGK